MRWQRSNKTRDRNVLLAFKDAGLSGEGEAFIAALPDLIDKANKIDDSVARSQDDVMMLRRSRRSLGKLKAAQKEIDRAKRTIAQVGPTIPLGDLNRIFTTLDQAHAELATLNQALEVMSSKPTLGIGTGRGRPLDMSERIAVFLLADYFVTHGLHLTSSRDKLFMIVLPAILHRKKLDDEVIAWGINSAKEKLAGQRIIGIQLIRRSRRRRAN